MSDEQSCPCGRGPDYRSCCQPLHTGAQPAASAERLMRSRYSAFALGQSEYLLRSWHASTRPTRLDLDPLIQWRRLLIEATEAGGPFDTTGYVTFAAIARTPAGRLEQRERSRFVREHGHWFYLDGVELGAAWPADSR